MRNRTEDRVKAQRVLVILLALSIISWSGLAYFTYAYEPAAWARVVFLLLLVPAAFATLMPVAYTFHTFWSGSEDGSVKLQDAAREAGLLTMLLEIWAVLRMMDALNWISMLIMLGIVALAEALILLRGK